jgi:hypothetical protein
MCSQSTAYMPPLFTSNTSTNGNTGVSSAQLGFSAASTPPASLGHHHSHSQQLAGGSDVHDGGASASPLTPGGLCWTSANFAAANGCVR